MFPRSSEIKPLFRGSVLLFIYFFFFFVLFFLLVGPPHSWGKFFFFSPLFLGGGLARGSSLHLDIFCFPPCRLLVGPPRTSFRQGSALVGPPRTLQLLFFFFFFPARGPSWDFGGLLVGPPRTFFRQGSALVGPPRALWFFFFSLLARGPSTDLGGFAGGPSVDLAVLLVGPPRTWRFCSWALHGLGRFFRSRSWALRRLCGLLVGPPQTWAVFARGPSMDFVVFAPARGPSWDFAVLLVGPPRTWAVCSWALHGLGRFWLPLVGPPWTLWFSLPLVGPPWTLWFSLLLVGPPWDFVVFSAPARGLGSFSHLPVGPPRGSVWGSKGLQVPPCRALPSLLPPPCSWVLVGPPPLAKRAARGPPGKAARGASSVPPVGPPGQQAAARGPSRLRGSACSWASWGLLALPSGPLVGPRERLLVGPPRFRPWALPSDKPLPVGPPPFASRLLWRRLFFFFCFVGVRQIDARGPSWVLPSLPSWLLWALPLAMQVGQLAPHMEGGGVPRGPCMHRRHSISLPPTPLLRNSPPPNTLECTARGPPWALPACQAGCSWASGKRCSWGLLGSARGPSRVTDRCPVGPLPLPLCKGDPHHCASDRLLVGPRGSLLACQAGRSWALVGPPGLGRLAPSPPTSRVPGRGAAACARPAGPLPHPPPSDAPTASPVPPPLPCSRAPVGPRGPSPLAKLAARGPPWAPVGPPPSALPYPKRADRGPSADSAAGGMFPDPAAANQPAGDRYSYYKRRGSDPSRGRGRLMGRRCSPGGPPSWPSVRVRGGVAGGVGPRAGLLRGRPRGGSRPLPKPTAARRAPALLPLPPLFRGCRPPSVWAVVPLVPVWAPGRAGVEGGSWVLLPPPSRHAGAEGGGFSSPSPRWPDCRASSGRHTSRGGCKRKRLRCASPNRESQKKKTQRSVLVRMRNGDDGRGWHGGGGGGASKGSASSGPTVVPAFFCGRRAKEERKNPPRFLLSSPPQTTVRGRGRISVQFDRKPARSLLFQGGVRVVALTKGDACTWCSKRSENPKTTQSTAH